MGNKNAVLHKEHIRQKQRCNAFFDRIGEHQLDKLIRALASVKKFCDVFGKQIITPGPNTNIYKSLEFIEKLQTEYRDEFVDDWDLFFSFPVNELNGYSRMVFPLYCTNLLKDIKGYYGVDKVNQIILYD